MHTKLLIGPVTPTEAALAPLWELSGNRTFVAGAGVDEALRPSDGWRPEALALFLTRQGVPPAVWAAPLPVIGLATNWGRSFHAFREFARLCDRVLIGPDGVEHARRLGLSDVRAADLDALPLAAFGATPNSDCEYDILLACEEPGTFDAAWREALAIVLGLAERWNVLILPPRSPVWEQAARRSRLVLVACPPGGDQRPALTAVASGALVFCWPSQPGGTQLGAASEAFDGALPERVARLNIFLRDEKARRDRVESALAQAREHCAERAWRAILGIDRHEEAHVTRVASRGARVAEDTLAGRLWFWLGEGGDGLVLSADIAAALVRCPESAALHNALGLTVEGRTADEVSRTAGNAVRHFRRAFELDGGHAMAGLNLAEALLAAGQSQEARDLTESLLATMSTMPSLPASVMAAGHFPAGEQPFHGLWERAAATHPDSPDTETKAKRALMAARLHTLAAALTDDLLHHYEAVIACPDLIPARAALGCALARAGQIADGIPHLWAATEGNPFDAAAARLLDRALEATGDHVGRRRLAYRQRLLARSAPSLLSHEPWFDNAPPLGDELTSIIIPCCDQVEYTRQCITSLVQHTRQPYELILVDNGSTDETPAYFAEVRKLLGPDRVRIIRNESNLGFAKACNQGLATADGLYLILLNNDVILTNGWLEGLIRWSLIDWPRVGIVGPVTNHASPPQEIPVEYASLDELEVFAAKRRWEYAGTCLEFPRLIGFCLLIRRDVLSAIGSLDERYGIGFFEDDDLCLRANDAGYRLLIALDTFVHHFGSRTFTGLGINASQQLRTNFAKFQDKWGGERTVGYRLPKDDSARTHAVQASKPLADVPAPTVSLCLIVRDEEANLPDCLESVRGLFAEVVVVDTGSTDRTRRIAAEFGAKVVEIGWPDSFAEARNASLDHATGEWVVWMDADERLDNANRDRLRRLLARLPGDNTAFLMRQFSPLETADGAAYVDQVRLFRRLPGVRWRYRVHEQILPSLREHGARVEATEVTVLHVGFAEPTIQGAKVDRNLRLLELDLIDRPGDSFVLFNLGAVALTQGRLVEAERFLSESLANSHPSDTLVPKLHALLVRCLHRQGRIDDALTRCREARKSHVGDPELSFWEAVLLREKGDLTGAEQGLLRTLNSTRGSHPTSIDAGLQGYRTRQLLAETYRAQGRDAEAEAQLRTALAEKPEFLTAHLALGDLLLSQGRVAELETAAVAIEVAGSPNEAKLLRARGHLARKEYAAARRLLDELTRAVPDALGPYVLLSHVLLQEGIDSEAAEAALRAILAREPTNHEARHNFRLLRLQRPRHTVLPAEPTVSLCLIVRDEEANLPDCLESVRGLFAEVVVVDTGSTDRTRRIAAEFGAKVVDFPWVDDFALARNESLSHATGRWVFWMDADDRLDEANRERLRSLIANLPDANVAYAMKCECVGDSVGGGRTVVDHVRLFRNRPDVHWEYRIHEQILPSLRRSGAEVLWSDVVIRHMGYANAAVRTRKRERDQRLLSLENAERPDDPFTLFNMASVACEREQHAEAIPLLRRSLERSHPGDSIVRKLYALLAQSLRRVDRLSEALRTCADGLRVCPDDTELLFLDGQFRLDAGDPVGAAASLQRLLTGPTGQHFASLDAGLRGHKGRHALAVAYYRQGRATDAEREWLLALAEAPAFIPARLGLAELLLAGGRWDELERVADELGQFPDSRAEALTLLARSHLARKDFKRTRELLNQAVVCDPEAVWPLVILSHALLQEGNDGAEAEQVLRRILAREPNNSEARHNLAILLGGQIPPTSGDP